MKSLTQKLSAKSEDISSIGTIYLGGGTPSQLAISQLQQLFDAIDSSFNVSPGAEVTIECNPDDVTATYADALPPLSVNRVSMGAQTFNDSRLRFLHRRHTASQVTEAVRHLRRAGIGNVSIDLMYGFPGETLDDWQRDIDAALTLGVEHLSAYCLTIEEGTPLFEKMYNGSDNSLETCDEKLQRLMYYTLTDRLHAAGYEHYELSNFARPGHRSRHNSSYWTDVPYFGLGAAAHSYYGRQRWWNPANIIHYIKGVEDNQLEHEAETIDAATYYNDLVMLRLRTREGIDLSLLTEADLRYLLPLAAKHIGSGLLVKEGNSLHLSREGLFLSDLVISDLMRI